MTESAIKFAKAQERLDKSFQKFGQASIKAVLPLMQKAASLAEKVAGVIEKNPKILDVGLSIGIVTATVGAFALAASKGMKIYADLKYLAANTQFTVATKMFDLSVNKFLVASKSPLGKGGGITGLASKLLPAGGTAGLAGAASIAATVATVLAVIAAGTGIGILVYDLIAKLAPKLGLPRFGTVAAGAANIAGQGMEKVAVAGGMDADEAKRKTLVLTYVVGKFFGAIKEGDPAWKGVVDGAKKAASATEDAASGADELGKSADELADKERQAAEIMSSLATENAASVRKYADDVESANISAGRSLADASRQAQKAVADIESNLVQSTTSIRSGLKKGLADLSASYKQASMDAEREYQQQRAEIAIQGAENEAQIQVDKQKELEQLEKDHADTMAGLIDSRDALAIYNANKDYEDRKSEIESASEERAQQAQAETKKQLAEAQQNYNQQRALRAQEYARQQDELRQQAAAQIAEANAKAVEEKAAVAKQLEEQKAEINRKHQEELADLQRNFNIEKRERAIAASEQLKALDGALKTETDLKRQYYGVMIGDTQNFMNAQRSAMSQGATAKPVGSRQIGGYTAKGLYEMHDEEFVATRSTTKALEALIGGKLTQRSLLAVAGGSGQQVTWNDQRRFYGEISPAQRRMNTEDTARVIAGEMRDG